MAQNAAEILLRQRLLNDIAEIQHNPYPGIDLHFEDHNALQKACLVLTPQGEGERPLHLTVTFGEDYPLSAPKVTMQSDVAHPNIYGDYVCASILNTKEGYTPAYTLKGICIQLLSFFGSDSIEQDTGGVVSRVEYQQRSRAFNARRGIAEEALFQCSSCGFGSAPAAVTAANTIPVRARSAVTQPAEDDTTTASTDRPDRPKAAQKIHLVDLPNDVLLMICDHLNDEGLALASRAWNGFGRLIRTHNIITTREMCCFTLNKGFKEANLGVGVHVHKRSISSEFDLISREAYRALGVRRSVQGLQFEFWLPLPMSQNHWTRVKGLVDDALNGIGRAASVQGPVVNVLYTFMNDVVVQLSQAASESEQGRQSGRFGLYGTEQKSTLTHASEKAVESYYQLFSLLVCLATDRPGIAESAKAWISRFMAGERDKQACPNLGHLLVALLISDISQTPPEHGAGNESGISKTEELTKAIIKEAVTRNVVWMLDSRGAGMAELSYMEPSAISDYRIQKTFEASKTSYRLLMFLNLMRRTVTSRPPSAASTSPQSLQELRDDLFSRHGAPPPGAASSLAASIRKIQKVDSFPEFLQAMDVSTMPMKSEFTKFLRRAVYESIDKGYSKWALTQEEALALRLEREKGVEVPEGLWAAHRVRPGRYTFFPAEQRGGAGGRGGRGGR